MYRYSTLENISNEKLYEIFMKAFEEFPIVKETDINGFCDMLKEHGYDPMISVGAFHPDTDELIGFILNSIKNETNMRAAYAILIGTNPMYQRQGIMKELLLNTRLLLVQKDVTIYTTEVLISNTSALAFYQSQGFKIQKEIITDVKTNTGIKEVIQYEITLDLID